MVQAQLSGTSISESSSDVFPQFTINLDQPATSTIDFGYRIISGTAQVGTDVRESTRFIRFSPGEQNKSFQVRVEGDNLTEFDESFVVEAYVTSGNATFDNGSLNDRVTSFIRDDDNNPTPFALYVSRPIVIENGSNQPNAQFELSFSRPLATDVSIQYATFDGSATAGEDYVAQSGTLNLIAGQQNALVNVPIIGDGKREANEKFGLDLDLPNVITDASIGLATIIDDDGTGGGPIVTLLTNNTQEGSSDQFPDFALSLDEPTASTINFDYRIVSGTADAGVDVRESTSFIRFSAGDQTRTFSTRVEADNDLEFDEAYVIEAFLTSGNARFANGASTARITSFILDDDGATSPFSLFIDDVSVTEGDGGTTNAAFEVNFSRPATQDFTINYTTVGNGSAGANSDFVPVSGTLEVSRGQTAVAFAVPIIGDAVDESNESFLLSLTPSISIPGKSVSVATIVDNDIPFSTGPDFRDFSQASKGITVDALAGNDTVSGSRFADQLVGGDGNDRLQGRAGNDRLFGDAGEDLLVGSAGNDTATGGSGNDFVRGGTGNDNLSGDGGNDFIFGENGRDALRGGAQNDRLFGGNGADTILGEAGNDLLNGGTGRDLLLGGAGDDNLFGGAGIDTINGGAGNDVITLTDALDVVVGGSGIDTVRTASVSINLANTVGVERAVVFGQQDFRLLADSNGAVANTLFGNAGDNVIAGFAGNDLLGGNAGDDRLIGGPGNDVLIGGFGRDLLEGGGGRDQFRYDAVGDSRPGATRDVIVGFQNGDRINLALLDADVRAGGNQAFTSVGSAGFTGAGGEVRYKVAGESTFVQVDITGNRSPDLEILLREFTDLGDASFIF